MQLRDRTFNSAQKGIVRALESQLSTMTAVHITMVKATLTWITAQGHANAGAWRMANVVHVRDFKGVNIPEVSLGTNWMCIMSASKQGEYKFCPLPYLSSRNSVTRVSTLTYARNRVSIAVCYVCSVELKP